MKFCGSEASITATLSLFLRDYPRQAALVSADVPLISNQDVYLNIAMIKQYHENMSKAEARHLALEVLKRVGLESIACKRNPALAPDERFCAMLLRAAMMKDAVLVIDRPFKIIPHLQTAQYIADVLGKIDDLYVSCHIFDYFWMEEKYGVLCR